MAPLWIFEVPKFAATPGDAARIIEFMLDFQNQSTAIGVEDFAMPVWLQETPTRQKCVNLGWPIEYCTPKQFIDHFGEEKLAQYISAVARGCETPMQHLVYCPQSDPLVADLGAGPTRWVVVPYPILIEPTVDMAVHAPLYLKPDLLPLDLYRNLPGFPYSRPNMIANDPCKRLPSYDPQSPVVYKNYEGVYLPYPDWYRPTQLELHELPNGMLQKYSRAIWRRDVFLTIGVPQKHLEEAQCKVCRTHLPLQDSFSKRVRHKYRTKSGYRPACRDCYLAAHLLELVPNPPSPPSPDSSACSSQDLRGFDDFDLPDPGAV